MFIKNITLQGYGPFRDVRVPLWDQDVAERKVTVLIGENGAGKSAFLEGIATLLSWLVARVRAEKGNGSPIESLKMRHDCSYSLLKLDLHAFGEAFDWQSVRVAKGKRGKEESDLKDASRLAGRLITELEKNKTLPLLGFYPTERYVLDYPKKIRTRHQFEPINGYDSVLTKGIDFRLFFEWFRDREDIRNEGNIAFEEVYPFLDFAKLNAIVPQPTTVAQVAEVVYSSLDEAKIQKENPALYARLRNRNAALCDKQYWAVVKAIQSFMPDYSGLRIERRPRMRMLIDKRGQSLDILQLSQGEKSLLALVGDIARRLAIMNPNLENPLCGEGIILIDEVDLHLHPRWQRTIVRQLRETFPNCQFILTTHSPLVISDPDNIHGLVLKDGSIETLDNLYGMDIEQVLLEVMGTAIRHTALQTKLDDLLDAIEDGDSDKVQALRSELGKILAPDHRELVRADILAGRKRMLHEKNH